MSDSALTSKPFLPWWAVAEEADWSAIFGREAPLEVEIGFGNGELMADVSRERPDTNFVGIEMRWTGVGRLGRQLAREGRTNVRLLQVDAQVALEWLFRPSSVTRASTLFPCPWPKKKSAKHRLHTHDFFRWMNSRLVDGGEFLVVTDWEPYFEWILEQWPGTGFALEWKKVPPRFGTRYERKWQDQGQQEFFEMRFEKVEHCDLPRREPVTVQSHYVAHFDPERFTFEEVEGYDLTMRCKEMLFDAERAMAMFRVVIVEQNLLQHIWVKVARQEKGWKVYPAAGTGFVPTSGILDAVRRIAVSIETQCADGASEHGA